MSKDKEIVAQEVYSKRLQDGTMLETIYDKKTQKSILAVSNGLQISYKEKVEYNDEIYIPVSPKNSLLVTSTVKLPSVVKSYESELELHNEVQAYVHKYVQVPVEFESLVAWYIMFTWVYDEFRELPYLRIIGDLGCGKSRFLFTVGNLCYKPIFINGTASTAALFRMIDVVQGTLVFDEADMTGDTTNEMTKILNSGFQANSPVIRAEEQTKEKGKSFDPKSFSIFGPKLMATRKDFGDDALESRCLTAPMSSLTRDDIPENLDNGFETEALEIRNKLLMYRFFRLQNGIKHTRLPKMDIEPRLRQIISPVYSMVQSEEAKQSIVDFIKVKELKMREMRYNSFNGEIFRSFLEVKKVVSMPTCQEISDYYNENFNTGFHKLKARKAGTLFDQIFHLEKKRISEGTIILETRSNEVQIEKLKKKYSIDVLGVDSELATEELSPQEV